MIVEAVLVILLGLILGSFATAVAYRLPRGKQFITGRSKCTNCQHSLGFFDLFPVVSWLLLMGKCRYCHKKFGMSYIFIEIGMALMLLLIYLQLGITIESALLAALSLCIVIMIAVDLEHYIIPDSLNIAMFVIGALYMFRIEASWQQFVFGPIFGFLVGFALRQLMWIWKKKEGLGLGDVKFLAVVGLMLPLEAFTTFLFMAGVIGIITALIWRFLGRGKEFPFGPALSIALYFCLILPDLHWFWQDMVGGVIMRLVQPEGL